MQKVSPVFAAVPLILLHASAMASQQSGSINLVAVASVPSPGFAVAGSRTAMPTCATDATWAIPQTTDDSSKQMIAAVLTAYASGRPVLVQGSGTCNAQQTNRENVSNIVIQ